MCVCMLVLVRVLIPHCAYLHDASTTATATVMMNIRTSSHSYLTPYPPSLPQRPRDLGLHWHGTGAVIVAGGAIHLTNAWLAIRSLQRVHWPWPIELFHDGGHELVRTSDHYFLN